MPCRVISCVALLLSVGIVMNEVKADEFSEKIEPPDWRKTLKSIRNGIHRIDTYLNMALDLIGGSDGRCLFKCSDGWSYFRHQ